jgi:dihydroflavonol-4-reductase
MKTLITGATGFLGSAVSRKLLARGDEVRAMVRPSSDRALLTGLDLEIVTGDLADPGSLAIAAKGCDALYHVAADYRLWVRDVAAMHRANVEGTRNIVLAAAEAGAGRIVYTSSVAVLATTPDGSPADEETPTTIEDMLGPYKRTKYLAEREVHKLVAERGAPVVIVNPSMPVGPRDIKPTPTGRMVLEAAAGRMKGYVDTGLNMVHVDDCAAGHLLAYDKGRIGERYILGGENMTLKAILTEIAEITGGRPPWIKVPPEAVLPVAYAAQAWAWMTKGREPLVTVVGVRLAKKPHVFRTDKAKDELGYAPRPAREGLIDAVEWFRENGYLR